MWRHRNDKYQEFWVRFRCPENASMFSRMFQHVRNDVFSSFHAFGFCESEYNRLRLSRIRPDVAMGCVGCAERTPLFCAFSIGSLLLNRGFLFPTQKTIIPAIRETVRGRALSEAVSTSGKVACPVPRVVVSLAGRCYGRYGRRETVGHVPALF